MRSSRAGSSLVHCTKLGPFTSARLEQHSSSDPCRPLAQTEPHVPCFLVLVFAAADARVLESTPKCTSCTWAWASGWGLVVIILLTYPFAVFRGYLAGPKSGKTLSSFTNFWLSHHVLILLFTPLLVFHSIPALPKGDTEGGSLTSSKAWMFIGTCRRSHHVSQVASMCQQAPVQVASG